MLAMAVTPDAIGTRDASDRPLLSAAAGAKSREEPGQERPKAALNTEHGEHASNEPSGRTRDESNGRRGQRAGMLSRSWLRFVLMMTLNIATGPARVNAPQVRPAQ